MKPHLIMCTLPSCQTTAGCQCQPMTVVPVATMNGLGITTMPQDRFAGGRLAGIREAAEVAKKPTTIGGPSVDFVNGYIEAQDRIHASLLALAEGKEG